MPELPEVETIVRELNRDLPGRQIQRVRVFRDNALGGVPVREFSAGLEGAGFGPVARQGKFLIFHLTPAAYLVGHLRMTGKFILSDPLPDPEPHHRVWFELADGGLLIFEDMRCFGTLSLVEDLARYAPLARLGVDPLSEEFTAEWLTGALAGGKSPLKHWLMDQGKIAGLGNIYAAEIMFRAGVSPLAPAAGIKKKKITAIHQATREVMKLAIEKNGTTISDYRRVDDKTGEFQNSLQVYGKEGEPCPRCGKFIARIKQQQRSTFYCPSCQN